MFLFKLFKTTDASFQNTFISLVFQRLLAFVLYACYNSNPISSLSSTSSNSNERGTGFSSSKPNDIVSINFVPFGEKALLMVTSLYEESASHESVIENFILKSIIQVAKQFYFEMNSINYILFTFLDFLCAIIFEIFVSESKHVEVGDRMFI